MKGMVEYLITSIEEVEKEIEQDVFSDFSPANSSKGNTENHLNREDLIL